MFRRLASRSRRVPLKRHNSSFAFSGSGWLTPFYFGVLDTLMSQSDHNLINDDTLYAGSSGGALASLVAFTKMSPEYALEEMIKISTHKDVYTKVDKLLRASVQRMVTETFSPEEIRGLIKKVGHNSHENRKLLNICLTRIYPSPSLYPVIINTFDSLDDVIQVTAASCFIPLWSDISGGYPKLDEMLLNKTYSHSKDTSGAHQGSIRDDSSNSRETILGLNDQGSVICIDGGISAFMPPIGDIRVSPFPPTFVLNTARKPHIYLDISNNHIDVSSLPHLLWLSWKPSEEAVLRGLYKDGQRATMKYLESIDKGKL